MRLLPPPEKKTPAGQDWLPEDARRLGRFVCGVAPGGQPPCEVFLIETAPEDYLAWVPEGYYGKYRRMDREEARRYAAQMKAFNPEDFVTARAGALEKRAS